MNKDSVHIRLGVWEELRQEASALRFEVFVREQQVPVELELDEMDPLSLHALAVDAVGRALGTGRLLPDGHVGRMAVRAGERNKGVGTLVLQALIEAAKRKGFDSVVLGAQLHAKGFYVRQGFVEYGEVYMDANIPHIMMKKVLVCAL